MDDILVIDMRRLKDSLAEAGLTFSDLTRREDDMLPVMSETTLHNLRRNPRVRRAKVEAIAGFLNRYLAQPLSAADLVVK